MKRRNRKQSSKAASPAKIPADTEKAADPSTALAEADYVIELGPGGGPNGGEILYQGELSGLLKVKQSPTAPYLRAKLRK